MLCRDTFVVKYSVQVKLWIEEQDHALASWNSAGSFFAKSQPFMEKAVEKGEKKAVVILQQRIKTIPHWSGKQRGHEGKADKFSWL